MGESKRLRERRASLYKWAEKELGFTEKKAREILLASGVDMFREDEIPHYRALLKHARGKMDDVANKLTKLNEEAKKFQQDIQCPIPGCSGTLRTRGRREVGWKQTCTEGGDIHPIIWMVAELAVAVGGSDGRNHAEMAEWMITERSNREQKTTEEDTNKSKKARSDQGTQETQHVLEPG